MTYVTANLHGCYTQFTELLRQIKLSKNDVLYVLGDIVDYGDEPMELICDLSMRYNVYAVAGDHDFLAARMLSGFEKMLKKGKSPDQQYIAQMNAWVNDGGKPTLDGYRKLDSEMKEGIIDYLSDMSLYEDINVKGKSYILVHAGLGSLAFGNPDPKPAEMFFSQVEWNKKYFDGMTVIAGHVPTDKIPGAVSGKIFRTENCIAVDCGAGRGGRIGCIRLDDGAEFYA
jgi:serine/threonine protein phosphatase 1